MAVKSAYNGKSYAGPSLVFNLVVALAYPIVAANVGPKPVVLKVNCDGLNSRNIDRIVAAGNVSTGNVGAGLVSAGFISTGLVSAGNVSTGLVGRLRGYNRSSKCSAIESNGYGATVNFNRDDKVTLRAGVFSSVAAYCACPRGIAVRDCLKLVIVSCNILDNQGIYLSLGVIGHLLTVFRRPCRSEYGSIITGYCIECTYITAIVGANAPLVIRVLGARGSGRSVGRPRAISCIPTCNGIHILVSRNCNVAGIVPLVTIPILTGVRRTSSVNFNSGSVRGDLSLINTVVVCVGKGYPSVGSAAAPSPSVKPSTCLIPERRSTGIKVKCLSLSRR